MTPEDLGEGNPARVLTRHDTSDTPTDTENGKGMHDRALITPYLQLCFGLLPVLAVVVCSVLFLNYSYDKRPNERTRMYVARPVEG